jgi:two-component system, LytTR family, response regulator
MNVIIVDDGRLARNELRRLLGAFADVIIVGEAANSDQARERVREHRPDAVFLDIQMPGKSGIDLLESLEPPLPEVVFTTAYDEFAVRAFALDAIDYLVKPVDPVRLADAVERLRQKLNSTEPPLSPGLLSPQDRVFVRDGDRCWFVQVREIRLMESQGNYTRVHFEDAQPMLFRSLTAILDRLDPKHFFRANRNQVVNVSWVRKIEPWFGETLLIHLEGGAKVELSRRQSQRFRERTSL